MQPGLRHLPDIESAVEDDVALVPGKSSCRIPEVRITDDPYEAADGGPGHTKHIRTGTARRPSDAESSACRGPPWSADLHTSCKASSGPAPLQTSCRATPPVFVQYMQKAALGMKKERSYVFREKRSDKKHLQKGLELRGPTLRL